MLFNKRDAIFICAIIASQIINSHVSTAAFIFLTLYALKGVVESVKALSLLPYLYLANGAILSISPYWSIARWAVLLTASAVLFRGYFKKKLPLPKWFGYLLLFNLVALLSSLLYSYDLKVSIVKLTVFTIVISSILLGYKATRNDFKPWYFTLFSTILVLSTVLMPTHLGYIRNNFGFQGILNQPNAYGIYIAPFCAWLMAMIILKKGTAKCLLWTLLIIAIVNVYLSRSRTALFAITISIMVTLIISFLTQNYRKDRKKSVASKRFITRVFFIMSVIGIIILVPSFFTSNNIVTDKIISFVYKNNDKTEKGKTLLKSRKETLEISMNGFKKNPVLGIGFGISADPKHFRTEETDMGIPTSGSAEKGNLVIALLEENGIVGLSVFSFFIFLLFKPLIKNKQYESIIIFVSAIMVNMGEMVFFSPGGLGTQIFLMMGFARSLTFSK